MLIFQLSVPGGGAHADAGVTWLYLVKAFGIWLELWQKHSKPACHANGHKSYTITNVTSLLSITSVRKLLWRKSSVLSPSDFFRKKNLRKIFSIGALRTWVDSLVLLLIIEVKINFSWGFDNTDYQTNKLQNVHALHCTIVLYIVP